MKKINCYSKYCHFIDLLLFILTLPAIILPLVFFKDDSFNSKIIYLTFMLILSLITLFGFFYRKQYLLVKNKKFVLKNCFTIIKELDIDECYYEISSLPSYFGRRVINEKWICIYLKNNRGERFEKGFSNNKRYERIQLVFNEKNLEIIKNYIKSNTM